MTSVANIRTFRGDHRDAVLIDRTTMWGNPFRIGERTREQVIVDHRLWWYHPSQTGLRWAARHHLPDKTLLCHCKPATCHGDTIADYLNLVVPFYASLATEAA